MTTRYNYDVGRWFCLQFLLLVSLVVIGFVALHNGGVFADSLVAEKDGSIKANDKFGVNLDAILGHQRALVRECRLIQESKLARLRELHDSFGSAAAPDSSRPLTYEMPAVCMLILNWTPAHANDRLETINWFNNDDDDNVHNSNSSSKRRPRAVQDVNLFSDYLLDLDKWNVTEMKTNSLSPSDLERDKEAEELIENQDFRQAMSVYRDKIEPDLSPIILIPGLLGSRLQARLDKPNRVNVLCRKQSGSRWQEMWLSVKNFLPLLVDCWFDNARMVPDPSTGFTQSSPGVTVRVPDFGSVESVRVMDLSSTRVSKYYASIIELYTSIGYTPDKNLLAAPYDFRLAPQQLDDYFRQLDALIERVQQRRGQSRTGQPVTLVCHSMGCNNMLVYLRAKSSAWRRQHVRKLIALSSPWGGAFKALKALVVGDQLDLPLVSETKMRELARTFPSIAYLLPRPEVYASSNQRHLNSTTGEPSATLPIFVKTPSRQYDARQVGQILLDLGLEDQFRWFEQTSQFVRPYEPIEDLRVDCVHGQNIPTMESLYFARDEDYPNGPYELIKGEGDGTVNIESLKVCEEWESKLGSKMVRNFAIYNTNHLGVLSHPKTLKFLADDVLLND